MRDKFSDSELKPPPPGSWVVSKKEVVCSELATAIRLFFGGQDFMSAHVLAGAARDILRSLAKAKAIPTFWDQTKDVVVEEFQGKFFALMSAFYNFLKHGARDGSDTYKRYQPELTAHVLFEACIDFEAVFGGSFFEIKLMTAWFTSRYPRLIKPGYEQAFAVYQSRRPQPWPAL